PGNLRFDPNAERAWLLDLGLCTHIHVAIPEGATPRYLDPNLIGSNGRQRDLYALGLSALELLLPELRDAPIRALGPLLESPTQPTPPDTLRAALLKLTAQLVHPEPGRRPHARWLWREVCRLLAEPDPELVA